MKIIVATPLFPPEIGDIATYTKNIVEHLKLKNQVQVLAYAGQVEKIPGVDIYTVNKKQILFLRIWKYFLKLLNLSQGADLIYVQNSIAVNLPAILVKIITGKKIIINFVEDEAWKRARYLHLSDKSWENFLQKPEADFKINLIRKLQAWTLKKADYVLVSSQALAQALSSSYHISLDRIAVNYPLIEASLNLPFGQELQKGQIFVNSSFFSWCGLEAVIKAIDILKNKFPNIKLIIVGDGPLKKDLQKLVNSLALNNYINFKAWVSKAEKTYLLNSSELIIESAQEQDFSYFLIECLLLGKNILATNSAYHQEILGKQAIFIDGQKPAEIAQKISLIFDFDKSQAVVADRFSQVEHFNKLQKIFESITK